MALACLEKHEFEYHEWVVLTYARDYALLGGREPDGEYMHDYRRLYNAQERRHIRQTIRRMDFANRVANTLFGRRSGAACRID